MNISFLRSFVFEMEKQSGLNATHLDRIGLGILAAPSVKHLVTGKRLPDKNESRVELAGLGALGLSTLSRFSKHGAAAMSKVASKMRASLEAKPDYLSTAVSILGHR